MTRTPSFGEPAPMEGAGAYNRRSGVQAASLRVPLSMLEHAAATVPLPGQPAPVVIADYGASSGHNSLAPMKAAVSSLRQRCGADRAISVVHTDLPGNDFAVLFQTLADDPESYMKGDEAVFASAVGRSFYGQILPSCSVTLGWSSWAVQWLSHAPAQIPDHVQVAYSNDPAARAAFARLAKEDWHAFLLSRGKELCPGGRLVIVTMACSDDGDFGHRGVLEAMQSGLRQLTSEGLLRPAEVRQMAIPTFGRTQREFVEPFTAQERFGGLSLERIEMFEGDDRIWSQFERDGDASLFGASWAAFSRASVFPTLALGLADGRNDPRAPVFMDRLEAVMAAQLARKPGPTFIPLAGLVLVKA
ncbi:MAG: hypothetical protein JOZ42_00725 [Acetobacteraceae bacterium]|nr:hypothetical protein [Acetobacteraceae bacterium]